jgi:DNA-binding protein HU-beta
MTKTQLVSFMAEKVEITKKQAALFLESLSELAVKEAKKNDVFVVPGIGRLKKVQRKARTGRNPQTGEAIKIKASKNPKVSAGASFKKVVNGQAAAPKLIKAK